MPLTYPGEWKFGSDGVAVPPGLLGDIQGLVSDIGGGASSGRWDEQWVVETFKSRFGSTSSSSDLSWAYTDLSRQLSRWTGSGAKFADALWSAIEDVAAKGIATPSPQQVNQMFRKNGFPYRIEPPHLRREGIDAILADTGPESEEGAQPQSPYNLLEEIGKGGFGRVYKASRTTSITKFEYAIKRLDPSPFISDHARAKARFIREVQAVQRLNHRGIVHYIDAGMDHTGTPYLVMPLIVGKDLRTAAGEQAPKDRGWLMVEVLDAVSHAHGLDVLHRDLKPSNILVRSSDRQPIIVDFGQSYLFEEMDGPSLTTAAVGSLGYIPPEVQADPKRRTTAQDIYACGVMTYEIIASRRPDPYDYRPLAQVDPALSVIDPVVRRAIAPASARYAKAADLRDELRNTLYANLRQ